MYQGRLAADANRLGSIEHCGAKIIDLIDQMHIHGLLASPDPAVGNRLDIRHFGVTAIRDRLNKLAVHIVDEALQVLTLCGSEFAGGIASVLKLPNLE